MAIVLCAGILLRERGLAFKVSCRLAIESRDSSYCCCHNLDPIQILLQSYKLFLNNQRIVRKYLVMSIIFCTFVPVPESTRLTRFIHHLKHTEVMNKTWKTILQVISYVITLLLGGAAGNVM